ncbi:hypothetical protein [Tissierella praeacuta]
MRKKSKRLISKFCSRAKFNRPHRALYLVVDKISRQLTDKYQ